MPTYLAFHKETESVFEGDDPITTICIIEAETTGEAEARLDTAIINGEIQCQVSAEQCDFLEIGHLPVFSIKNNLGQTW